MKILNNKGHGQFDGLGKALLKGVGIILTFPISIPVIMIKNKLKEKKKKKVKSHNRRW